MGRVSQVFFWGKKETEIKTREERKSGPIRKLLNNLKNIELYNAAVSETAGDSMLYLCDINRGMHRLYQSHWCKEGSVKVKTMKIIKMIKKVSLLQKEFSPLSLIAQKFRCCLRVRILVTSMQKRYSKMQLWSRIRKN